MVIIVFFRNSYCLVVVKYLCFLLLCCLIVKIVNNWGFLFYNEYFKNFIDYIFFLNNLFKFNFV